MKIVVYFLLLYFILIGSIFSFYADMLTDHSRSLSSTKNKITGVEYLKLLHRLSIDSVYHIGDAEETNDKDKTLLANIKKIYDFQDTHPEFNNRIFNRHLAFIEKFHAQYKDIDYYNFYDYINYVNYTVNSGYILLFFF